MIKDLSYFPITNEVRTLEIKTLLLGKKRSWGKLTKIISHIEKNEVQLGALDIICKTNGRLKDGER